MKVVANIVREDGDEFNASTIQFVLNVKEGRQTFKWLAQVLQARLGVSAPSPCLVKAITNNEAILLDPRDSIAEHVIPETGICTVHVTVVSTFPSDVWGNPIYGDWMTTAYVRSELGQRYCQEMDAWRERLAAAVVDSSGKPTVFGSSSSSSPSSYSSAHTSSYDETSSRIQIGEEPEVQGAFDLDWTTMKWHWLSSPAKEHACMEAIKTILKERYHNITFLFKHYAGAGVVGERYALTKAEFAHLLHGLKVVNLATPSGESAADAIFEQCGIAEGVCLMTRPQLAQALVAVSVSISSSSPGDGFSPQSLQDFMGDVVAPFVSELGSLYCLYSIHDDILGVAYRDYYQLVRQAFLTFAVEDPVRGAEILLRDYMQLLVTSTLVFKDQTDQMVTNFLRAQVNRERERELHSLVFAEFMEAVSRLAIEIIDTDPNLSPGKRIRMAFSMLTDLQNLPKVHGRK